MATNDRNSGPSRRGFLKLASAGAAAVAVGATGLGRGARADEIPTPSADPANYTAGKFPPGATTASGRAIGANDRILVGIVGVGGQGYGAHVMTLHKGSKDNNVEGIAVADCYTPRVERTRAVVQCVVRENAFDADA